MPDGPIIRLDYAPPPRREPDSRKQVSYALMLLSWMGSAISLGAVWPVSDPAFPVGEVGFAGILGELGFECGDQASDVGLGQPIGRRHKHKPRVAGIARRDELNVKRPEVPQVGRHDRPLFMSRQYHQVLVG